MKNIEKLKCPNCESNNNVYPIKYGFKKGKLTDENYIVDNRYYSGGCMVNEDSPEWYCTKCTLKFGKKFDICNN